PATVVFRRSASGGGHGLLQSTALGPLFERHLPVAPAVRPLQLPLGAGDGDDVAPVGPVVEPLGVGGGGTDAAVAAVAPAEAGRVVHVLVDVLAAVGNAGRPRDQLVVIAGVALLLTGRDHAFQTAAVHREVDAACGEQGVDAVLDLAAGAHAHAPGADDAAVLLGDGAVGLVADRYRLVVADL